jgi:hypothetical protein
MLNIQLLIVRSSLHSSTSLECVEVKAYKENIQFVYMIIQDINTTGTSLIEFLHRRKQHWCVREQI